MIDEVARALDAGGDADDALRRVVQLVHDRLGRFVRISFVEERGLVAGPAAGEETGTTAFPISFQGRHVADLEVGGNPADERADLDQVAGLLAPYALVGWDIGGEEWLP